MEQDELLESFTFCRTHEGNESNYRVTADGECYAVEQDGRFIAELACCDGEWQQVQGTRMDASLV